ncbi:fumarylacetoacetate hydrolase FahA [Aaosphaeria arxii CBS 175.79]|uniref:Fumarylacetoacetase n=1 Tax=Aaosphaeria arxii CBS 175.79 TaxID=1450172 RepID=A0A6A5Y7Z3_9PLEO|nr:fumarylacetoacetate hydrolase FahA [Aaosphaeria arxii CBS 175.79]KAF2021429.1 fumarylacetoacetate hydrolase FahA [Aaosphaeria arxii CBS 175.79]
MPSKEASQFGINNIPYGIASSAKHSSPQCVTRIGDNVIFLASLSASSTFKDISADLPTIFQNSTLNAFASLPKQVHSQVRAAIQAAYKDGSDISHSEDIKDVTLHVPVQIGDFTDFSASRDHVLNAGEAILGERSYPPSFHKYPIGYAGRCSSIVPSGTAIQRPLGQFIENYAAAEKNIIFGPCRALDYELEVGAVVGRPLAGGKGLHAKDAEEHIFGLILVNDWSARDIQGLEMNPLGPFNGKNFATTVSSWVVTSEALEAHKVAAPERMSPVAGFLDAENAVNYRIDLAAEITRNGAVSNTCKVGFDTMYWTFAHMLAHHTVGGCGLRTGDLIASGTVSGQGDEEHGCLLEMTKNGKVPWKLSDGDELRYLEDGDEVRFTGIVGDEKDGIGFGECIGTVLPARQA